jgi:predicted transcriptional regulator
MRKYRDNLEIVSNILKATKEHSSKTGIMEAANLNFYNVNSYLEIALNAGFLVVNNHNYEITEKGKFLEKYLELTNNLNEVKSSLEELKEEKRALESVLVNKTDKELIEEIIPIEKEDKPLIINVSLERINPVDFYEELTNLGFTKIAAMKIISWIDLIYKQDKFFFSGKRASLIKACLACNGSVILGAPNNVTRRVISRFFKVNIRSIQGSYKDYRRFILEENIESVK